MVRFLLSGLSCLALVAPAFGAPISGTYVAAGSTVANGDGTYTLTSTDSTFSILRYVFNTPVPFNQLTSLSVAYNAQLGGIGGGAPRLAVVLDTGESFEINFGPAGSFVDPALGPGNTGNLLAQGDLGRYDNTGIGGAFYSTLAEAQALAGSKNVVRVSLILDSFGGNDKRFVIDGANGIIAADAAPAAVPEPATLAVFGVMGVATLGLRRLRKARA